MKRRLILALALFAPFAFAEDAKKEEVKPAEAAKPAAVTDIKIKMVTDAGDIEATIFASKVPMTAANFLNLAMQGQPPPRRAQRLSRWSRCQRRHAHRSTPSWL